MLVPVGALRMDRRPLGETGHDSLVLTFGAIALNWLEQEDADQLFEHVRDHGVTHFDVAPTDDDAEPELVTMMLAAAADDEQMDDATQRSLVERCRHDDSPVTEQLHH
jgi:predicted aldo/keto reductase-like oxidoreductase